MKEKISFEALFDIIRQEDELLGIGLHGIHAGTIDEKINIAQQISEHGLNLQHGWKSVLSTVVSLGNKVDENSMNIMENYKYGNGERCNVIVLSPMVIGNSEGERIFLGFPIRNLRTASQQYQSTCVLDHVCSKLGRIPPEFIYGYYDETSAMVTQNSKHYSKLPSDKRDELFDQIKSSMNDLAKMISDLVIKNDMDGLEKIRANFQRMNWNEPAIDNAINALNNRRQTIKASEEDGRQRENATKKPNTDIDR